METRKYSAYSPNLGRTKEVRVYGTGGLSLIAFPTQDGMADQWEGFGMIDTLREWLETEQIRLFTVDTVDVRTWSNKHARKDFRARMQESYFRWFVEEAVPMVREINPDSRLPLLTGCSMGGAHCAVALLRRKSIVLCCGQGKGEDIELDATRILEKDLIDNDIPAWVDYWGTDVDHDWVWWKPQLRYFLPYVLDEINHR